MGIVKFKDLPGIVQDKAVETLSALIIQGGHQSLRSATTGADSIGVVLALKVREAFISLYAGPVDGVSKNENQVSDFFIQLDKAEIQSGVSRVKWAEGLIRQLPESHDGRNSWLLNYGSQNNDTSTERAIIEASKKAESAMRSGS